MRGGLVREDGLLRGINSVKNCTPGSNRVQAAPANAGAWALPDSGLRRNPATKSASVTLMAE